MLNIFQDMSVKILSCQLNYERFEQHIFFPSLLMIYTILYIQLQTEMRTHRNKCIWLSQEERSLKALYIV